jgi:tetratricopeptide (TPR) repeat protein
MPLLERYREQQRAADDVKLDAAWAQLGGTTSGMVGGPRADLQHIREIRLLANDIVSRSRSGQQRYRARILLALCSQVEKDRDGELQQLKLSLGEERHNPAVYEMLCRNALRRGDLKSAAEWIHQGLKAMNRLSFEMEGCYALTLERMATNLRRPELAKSAAPLVRLLDADGVIGFQEHADPLKNHVLWLYQALARNYPEAHEEGLLRYACYLRRRFNTPLAIRALEGALRQRRAGEWTPRFYALLSDWLIRAGACQEALAALERGLQTYVDSEPLLFDRATALECLDREEAASGVLADLLHRTPNSAVAWLRAGVAALRMGNYAAAETDASSGLRLAPAAPPLWYLRALARMGMKDKSGALEQLIECERVAKSRPGQTDVVYGLDYKEACKDLPSDPRRAFPRASPVELIVPGAEDPASY